MTQDEIIEMADKAHGAITSKWWDMDVVALERFAKLVAEKEREACAKVCEEFAQAKYAAEAIRQRGEE